VSEVQARWVVYLIRNKIKLPTEEEMKKEIIERRVIFNFLVKLIF
jgi:hypothetical protein